MQKLHLDGSHISLQRFVELADGPVSISVAPSIRERLKRAREIVARYAASDQPVYGLNTGLGGNLQHRIEPKDIPAFQAQLLLARSAGVGPNASRMGKPRRMAFAHHRCIAGRLGPVARRF